MNRPRVLILPIAALAAALAISACTPTASSAPQATASSVPAGGEGSPPAGGAGGPGGLPAGGDFSKIQQCLEAAGLTLPSGSFPLPSGSCALPSGGFPSGELPSGSFAPPAGGVGGLNDPKVQAALEACGITLPGRGPAPSN